MSDASFTLAAPAKINLFLHITGRRADGYHNLQSLMCFTAAGDSLEFSDAPTLQITVHGEFSALLENNSTNLVYKAALLLAEEFNQTPRGKILLHKNLPIAAGIGGGSADAAAALIGLNKLWGINCDIAKLKTLALKLGADVPACVEKRTLFAAGIGEEITVLNSAPALHIVLVNPLEQTKTAEVFKNFNGTPYSAEIELKAQVSDAEFIKLITSGRNDLTAAAIKTTPVINDALAALNSTRNHIICRLSGSGATCFALYNNEADAIAAARKISALHPEWWVVKTHLLK